MTFLNFISFLGIFGLCAIAWLFSENRNPKYFPWRIVLMGVLLQLILGFLVFSFPITRLLLQGFSNLLNVVFDAADFGARFVFGRNLVPIIGQEPLLLSPLGPGGSCNPAQPGEVLPGLCAIQLGYVFAFRALPAVIFFSGFMALLYSLGIIQVITNLFAKIFYSTMRLSGAESLSGAANIFVGIEAAIVVKPFLAKMTRSELCAILACCFGTAASSTLAIYVNFLRPVFPNILGHLVSASIMAIPACFVLSKILVPETEIPLTAGGIPGSKPLNERRDPDDAVIDDSDFQDAPKETLSGEVIERVSPLDAAITGALDGVKMAISIAAVLILILGLVFLIDQLFKGLALLPAIGGLFQVLSLQNILGALFLPLTVLTGVSLNWDELWLSSVIIGRRLFETAIPPYQSLALAAQQGLISDRALLIVSYALSGFAHLASVGIFVGGVSALIPSRRKDVSDLGWKALFVGTLATMMIACIAGVFDTGAPGILGVPASVPSTPTETPVPPTPTPSTTPTPAESVTPPPAEVPPSPAPEAAPPAEGAAPAEAPPAEAPPAEAPPAEAPPAEQAAPAEAPPVEGAPSPTPTPFIEFTPSPTTP